MYLSMKKSPNFDIGRNGYKPEAIVLHKTEGSFISAVGWFQDAKTKVSAHYIIAPTGEIAPMVDENDTAWHAGVIVKPSWKLLKNGINPNLYTIGIELAGYAVDDTPADQALALAELICDIHRRWKIPIDDQHIVFHREIRANKTCPGQRLSKKLIIFYANTILWHEKQNTA